MPVSKNGRLAVAENAHDALLEYFRASEAWASTCGHEEATVEDERKAEDRFNKAQYDARNALRASGIAP
jgi:hypothetical protein